MNDDDARRLFESVGARDEPPSEVRERVRDEVQEAWQDLPAQRRRGTGVAGYGVAVGIVVAALSAWLAWMPQPAAPTAIAGHLEYATGGHAVAANGDLDVPRLAHGVEVRTAGTGRVLIRLQDGALLRLDAATRLTLHSTAELLLEHGRLFADSMGSEVVVTTPNGVRVENVGTQFEVAVDGGRVDVAVRQGRINAHVDGQSVRSHAIEGVGETVAFEGSNVVSRKSLPATASRWGWIHASMPAFVLDGATVFEFLTWAAAECGMTLEFASDRVSRQAKTVRLHGPSVPAARISREEIEATLQTVPSLRILPSKEHRLVVDRLPGRPPPAASN